MNIARIAGIALIAGLALFLISVLAKVLIVGGIVLFALRGLGRGAARLFYGYEYGPQRMGPGNWGSPDIISIDNPANHSPMYQPQFGRVISVG